MVQDAPGFTGTPMSPGAARPDRAGGPDGLRAEDRGRAAGTQGRAGRRARSRRRGGLGGAGGIDFWHELERGADGTVPGVAMAELFPAVHALHEAGDRDAARTLFNRHLPLIALATRDMDTFFAV